jgi:hypothetical protein
MFYWKRTVVYIVAASLVDILGDSLEETKASRFGKGFCWGSLFFSIWMGLALGSLGTGVGYQLEKELMELL